MLAKVYRKRASRVPGALTDTGMPPVLRIAAARMNSIMDEIETILEKQKK